MAVVLRLVVLVAAWLGGLAATRAVVEPAAAGGAEAFPQLAWPALALALLGAAGIYGLAATGWAALMQGRSGWLRWPLAVVWAGTAALVLLAAANGIAGVLAGPGRPVPPVLLLALLGSRPLWLAGLLLTLAAATLGARPPERRRRYGGGRLL